MGARRRDGFARPTGGAFLWGGRELGYHPTVLEKGKPVARRGRKATGFMQAAGPPKGTNCEVSS
jgi:hypothetical protein